MGVGVGVLLFGCVLYVGACGCGHVIVCSYSVHACVK